MPCNAGVTLHAFVEHVGRGTRLQDGVSCWKIYASCFSAIEKCASLQGNGNHCKSAVVLLVARFVSSFDCLLVVWAMPLALLNCSCVCSLMRRMSGWMYLLKPAIACKLMLIWRERRRSNQNLTYLWQLNLLKYFCILVKHKSRLQLTYK